MDASDIMTLIGSAQGVGQITSLLTTISKAKLICKEKRPFSLNFVPGNELEFQFNPTTLKMTREPDWDDGERLMRGAYRAMKFGGNRADRLTFSMLLDETEYRGSLTAVAALLPMSGLGGLAGFLFQNKSNTLAAMQQLYQLTMPHVEVKDKKSGKGFWRPPLVVFKWGDFAFSGVVDDLDFDTSRIGSQVGTGGMAVIMGLDDEAVRAACAAAASAGASRTCPQPRSCWRS